jgi:signal transduction histidine kinase
VVLGILVLSSLARATASLAEPRAIAAWLVALVFLVTFALGTVRPLPLAVAVPLWGLCSIAMRILTPTGPGFLFAIVALIQATRLAGTVSQVVAAAIGLGYMAAFVATTGPLDVGNLLTAAIGLVLAYVAAASFQRLREEKQKTEALLQEVLAGRDAQIRAAALDERARLAREIHDILAHTLSALSVQLESVRMLVEQRPGDPATRAAVERASHLAREGLDETRRAVGTLRGDALPGPDALPRLAADFERDSGIPCRLTVAGDPVDLSPEARLALYRTAQEAMTNVRKHADASAVDIHLRYGTDGAELTVEDRGVARPSGGRGGGHGLSGMRERAELVRGALEAGPTPTGFRVRLWLPA